jgi:xanthine dehydrogenase YagT iron-sulfur-binding subunit
MSIATPGDSVITTSRADIGAPAPDFSVALPDGGFTTLSALRGQPVILAFAPREWDPWRSHQLAHFHSVARQLPGAAELVAVSIDGAWCRATFPDGTVNVPMLGDLPADGGVAARYGVHGDAVVFLIDAAGMIVWRHAGTASLAPRIDDLLAALGVPEPTRGRPIGRRPTRREFLTAALAVACALALSPRLVHASRGTEPVAAPGQTVTLRINGESISLDLEPRVTLLDALREYAGLTGTKKGCDHGQCGACTVHVNGRRQLSCLTFAVMHQRDEITTIEGLANGSALHPMQAAFVANDGFQCGYCTPGQIMSATALLHEPCGSTDADVKECMSGNLCRCGAYPGIVAAIQSVRATTRG